MRPQYGCAARDPTGAAEIALRGAGNLIVTVVLPFWLGRMGAPLWYLPIYAVVAGIMLTVAEDLRLARELFLRSDVRSYTRVRIAMVAVLGAAPFVAGTMLHP